MRSSKKFYATCATALPAHAFLSSLRPGLLLLIDIYRSTFTGAEVGKKLTKRKKDLWKKLGRR